LRIKVEKKMLRRFKNLFHRKRCPYRRGHIATGKRGLEDSLRSATPQRGRHLFRHGLRRATFPRGEGIAVGRWRGRAGVGTGPYVGAWV